jgi:hypothetical protein
MILFLRPICWLVGHRWSLPLRSFGRGLARCQRCGAVRIR